MATNNPTVIETTRLHLRPVTLADSEDVVRLRTDQRIYYWRTPDTQEQAVVWLHDRLKDPLFGTSVIKVQLPGRQRSAIMGMIGASRLPEIGYIIDPDFWGKGYASEALKAWLAWYWDTFPQGHPSLSESDRAKIVAETGPEAAASCKVLQKCGFQHAGKRDIIEEGKPTVLDQWVYTPHNTAK